MPSNSAKEYRKNLTDVLRLMEAHKDESERDAKKRGKRGLGHYTKGAVVLLCAAWERYVESLIIESSVILTEDFGKYTDLPSPLPQSLRDFVNSNQTASTMAQLKSLQWRHAFREYMTAQMGGLNTPKYRVVKPLFKKHTHINDIALAWSLGVEPLDKFVHERGSIAHRGAEADYVHIGSLIRHVETITAYVQDTDDFMSIHISERIASGYQPWNRTSFKVNFP